MSTEPKVEVPLRMTPVEKEQTSQGKTNGSSTNGSTADGINTTDNKFDPRFTDSVINATGPKAKPRARRVLGSLIRHLHDFCRENEVTVDEWMSAVNFVRPRSMYSLDWPRHRLTRAVDE